MYYKEALDWLQGHMSVNNVPVDPIGTLARRRAQAYAAPIAQKISSLREEMVGMKHENEKLRSLQETTVSKIREMINVQCICLKEHKEEDSLAQWEKMWDMFEAVIIAIEKGRTDDQQKANT